MMGFLAVSAITTLSLLIEAICFPLQNSLSLSINKGNHDDDDDATQVF